MTSLLRMPSAWMPIALPLVALALTLVYVAVVGVVARPDEAAPARLFQLFMLVDAGLIVAFAIRSVPDSPRAATAIVGLQLLVAAIPVATIIVLEAWAGRPG